MEKFRDSLMIRDHHDLTMYYNWCAIPTPILTSISFMENFSSGSTSPAPATTNMASAKSSTTPQSLGSKLISHLHCLPFRPLTRSHPHSHRHPHPLQARSPPLMNSYHSFVTSSTSPSPTDPLPTLAPPSHNATMPSSPPRSFTASSPSSIKNAK